MNIRDPEYIIQEKIKHENSIKNKYLVLFNNGCIIIDCVIEPFELYYIMYTTGT